jgi:hypothetical protein
VAPHPLHGTVTQVGLEEELAADAAANIYLMRACAASCERRAPAHRFASPLGRRKPARIVECEIEYEQTLKFMKLRRISALPRVSVLRKPLPSTLCV